MEKQLFIHCHVRWLVIICHSLWLYHVACSSQKFLSCGRSWILAYWCLSFPSNILQSSHPWSLLECPTISVSMSCILSPLACPPCLAEHSQKVDFFLCHFIDRFQEGKGTVHIQFVAMLFCLLTSCCHVLSVLLQVQFRVIQVTIGITKFVNFDVKTLVLLGNIQSENYLPLNYAITLSVARFFKGL